MIDSLFHPSVTTCGMSRKRGLCLVQAMKLFFFFFFFFFFFRRFILARLVGGTPSSRLHLELNSDVGYFMPKGRTQEICSVSFSSVGIWHQPGIVAMDLASIVCLYLLYYRFNPQDHQRYFHSFCVGSSSCLTSTFIT